jgi:hypothetical protein
VLKSELLVPPLPGPMMAPPVPLPSPEPPPDPLGSEPAEQAKETATGSAE